MAFNLQTFKTRTLTALLFVAVMLVGLLWNFWSFFILFTVIHFGCWFEYFKLIEKIFDTKIDLVIQWFFAICGFTLMVVIGIQHNSFDIGKYIAGQFISFKLMFWVFLFTCLLIFLIQNKQIPLKAKWMSFYGLVYISLSFALFLNLRGSNIHVLSTKFDLGKIYVCLTVFSIWINDTMAYLVGSFIGKTPLSIISPKKTVEGTIGGIILCVIIMGVGSYLIYLSIEFSLFCIAIAAICGTFGTIGDLIESKLKRMADVKDSGSFMPGHGGFLDRFDSLIVAAPFVWLYVYIFTNW